MIRSMTGFGAGSIDVDGAHYVVEVRSLNNKYFKALLRLPEELQGLEPELESLLTRRLTRGSVVLTVKVSDRSADAAAQINTNAIQRYLDQILTVPGLEHVSARIELGSLLHLPGVVMPETGEELLDKARPVLLELTDEVCNRVLEMRRNEGERLHADLKTHCGHIAARLNDIRTRVPQVVEQYQERLRQRMETLLADSATQVREEDLIREVAIYAERSDIAEEVTRLQGHLEQFMEIVENNDSEPAGRTLDFISQEMLREANTIASKCLDAEISRRIVEIKGCIDRIKEQAQNVE